MAVKPNGKPNHPDDDSDERAQEPAGIKCRKCHCCDLRVLQTRKYLSVIRRQRICRHCGTTMWTSEIAPK